MKYKIPNQSSFHSERVATVVLLLMLISSPQILKASLSKIPHQDYSSSSRKNQDTNQFYVSGRITDIDNLPIVGANVLIKGTSTGVSTDLSGEYSIKVNQDDVLVFSFIGYKTEEVEVSGQHKIDVVLTDDVTSLNEITVKAGYWDVKEKERTGNIFNIKAKDIEKNPVSNSLASLQGRVPGLEITQQSGVPGGNFVVRIRSRNSISSGNDPLYIVDGVPYMSSTMSSPTVSGEILSTGTNPINNINPSDIESITVLKDADATAIYGSRGANGVVLINTKKGHSGKSQLSINFYKGLSTVPRKIDLLSTNDYLIMRKEAFRNDNISPSSANAPDLILWDTTRYTDWQDYLIGGTASMSDGQISMSGGDKRNQFSVGSGFHHETTVFPGSNSDRRVSAHASFTNISFNDKLKTDIKINYSILNTDMLKQDLTSVALMLPPNAPPVYTPEGDLNWAAGTWSNTMQNPLSYSRRGYESRSNNLISNVTLNYSLTKNIELKSNFGFTNNTMKSLATTPLSSYSPINSSSLKNQSVFSNSNFTNWIAEPQVNWKPRLLNGNFDILVGVTFLEQNSEGETQVASGFISESLMKNIGSASNRALASNSYSEYRYNAIFGRINYSIKGTYIINITGRRDGSSRFGPGKQFANFGAVGMSWILSNEDFISNKLTFLSFGKLRTSIGVTGNDQIGDYQYLDTYTNSDVYNGAIAINPIRLNNPDFAWETNRKIEIGGEFAFIDDKIGTEISYYWNTSSNQLVGYPLPPTAGFPTIQSNLPATVKNRGIEISLTYKVISSENFSWSSSLNFTKQNNKLTSYPNIKGSSYADVYEIGKPLSIRKLYRYSGIDETSGLYTFEDVNTDGIYNSIDRNQIKFIGPKFFGGIFNSLQYKGVQLDFLFQFVKQAGSNYLNFMSSSAPGRQFNQPEEVMDRWRNDDRSYKFQKFSTSAIAQNVYTRFRSSDASVTDASFIRLKNIYLSYSLPERLASKIKMKNIKIFIQSQNLLTITNYKGLDPENQNSMLPPLRTVTCGANLTL